MRLKDFAIIGIFTAALALSAFGQGLAINIVMKSAKKIIDERFVAGRLFWKPRLPLLFKPAKAQILSSQPRKCNFVPPFSKIERKN